MPLSGHQPSIKTAALSGVLLTHPGLFQRNDDRRSLVVADTVFCRNTFEPIAWPLHYLFIILRKLSN